MTSFLASERLYCVVDKQLLIFYQSSIVMFINVVVSLHHRDITEGMPGTKPYITGI